MFTFAANSALFYKASGAAVSTLAPSRLVALGSLGQDIHRALKVFMAHAEAKDPTIRHNGGDCGVKTFDPSLPPGARPHLGSSRAPTLAEENLIQLLVRFIKVISIKSPENFDHVVRSKYTSEAVGLCTIRDPSIWLTLVNEPLDPSCIVENLAQFQADSHVLLDVLMRSGLANPIFGGSGHVLNGGGTEVRESNGDIHSHNTLSDGRNTEYQRWLAQHSDETLQQIDEMVSRICVCADGYGPDGRPLVHTCEPSCTAGVRMLFAPFAQDGTDISEELVLNFLLHERKLISDHVFAAKKQELTEKISHYVKGFSCRLRADGPVLTREQKQEEPTHYDMQRRMTFFRRMSAFLDGQPHAPTLDEYIRSCEELQSTYKTPYVESMTKTTHQTTLQMYVTQYHCLYKRYLCGASVKEMAVVSAGLEQALVNIDLYNRDASDGTKGRVIASTIVKTIGLNQKRSVNLCLLANRQVNLVSSQLMNRDGVAPFLKIFFNDMLVLANYLKHHDEKHFPLPNGACLNGNCGCSRIVDNVGSDEIQSFLFAPFPKGMEVPVTTSLLELFLMNRVIVKFRSQSEQQQFIKTGDEFQTHDIRSATIKHKRGERVRRNGFFIRANFKAVKPPTVGEDMSNEEYVLAHGLPVVNILFSDDKALNLYTC